MKILLSLHEEDLKKHSVRWLLGEFASLDQTGVLILIILL
jgi:hypothetical protein